MILGLEAKMEDELSLLYSFLHATGGNWRNAILIECRDCVYEKNVCVGYLFTADRDGKPILISVDRFQQITKETVVKEECAAILSKRAFESVYSSWLIWQIDHPQECILLQLTKI